MISISDSFDILISLLKIKYFGKLNSAPAPRIIAYTVTWRCNAACDMCGVRNVDRNAKDKKQELSVGDVRKIFKDPLLRKLDLIRFTGGEPFLKEDFIDIVDEIIKNTRTKICYITTNGFYSEKIFDLVRRLATKTNNLVIQVSLDAPGEIHDNIRKVPHLYEKVMHTLEGLKILRNKYKFSFGVNQTVTPKTVRYIDEISILCKKFGCDHKIYVAQEAHESDILGGEKLKPELELLSNPGKDEIKNLYDRIEEHYKRMKRNKNSIFSPENLWKIVEKNIILGAKNRLIYNRIFPNPRCLAMFFYLRLLPDGRIMPCTLKPRTIGNLKDQTFTEVWGSKKANDMRSEIRNCKGCWVECDIVPNIMYSFDTVKGLCKEWRKQVVG